MSTKKIPSLGKRVRAIREAEGLGRAAFSEKIGQPKDTLIGIEIEKHQPQGRFLESVCLAFPQYALWLMTGNSISGLGQTEPEVADDALVQHIIELTEKHLKDLGEKMSKKEMHAFVKSVYEMYQRQGNINTADTSKVVDLLDFHLCNVKQGG